MVVAADFDGVGVVGADFGAVVAADCFAGADFAGAGFAGVEVVDLNVGVEIRGDGLDGVDGFEAEDLDVAVLMDFAAERFEIGVLMTLVDWGVADSV